MLGTPTTELGAFEYPLDAVSPAIRRLVADDHADHPQGPGSLLLPPGFTPALRRTSSTSTVPVSPAGGRRPSVVHSNTVPQAEAGRRFSLVTSGGDGEGLGPHSATAVVHAVEQELHASSDSPEPSARRASDTLASGRLHATASPSSPFPGRRPSILGFAHQQLPDAPVPPSLAHLVGSGLRRGSIPANQLLPVNMPPRDRRQSSISSISSLRSSVSSSSGTAAVVRNSLSGPVFTNQGTRDEQMTVSTAYLYQRRASLASTSRGLLSSNALPTVPMRPGLIPNSSQQRQGSVSSTTSSNPSSGSRESVATLRDFSTDERPGYVRHGSSNESTATERNRRMSMPALASPEIGMGWQTRQLGQMRMSTSGATPVPPIDARFNFPHQAAGRLPARPFTLGQLPSPRMQGSDSFTHETGSSSGTGSPRRISSSSSSHDPRRKVLSPHTISSSSEELSDTTSDPPDTSDQSTASSSSSAAARRGFRLSQRGIEARERRRSSRMSAISAAAGGNTLQTIPSEAVVDFTRTSARSSLISGGRAGMEVGDLSERMGERRGTLGVEISAVASDDEKLVDEKLEVREEPVEAITTAFRAFAFPPRK